MRWVRQMNLRTRSREEPEINLTSLIDVVLLLLVFFMITTSFVQESKVGIRLPEASSTATIESTSRAPVISVTAQGTYLVNGRALLDNRADTLKAALKQVGGESPGTRVTVSADADASHQAVITAMDIAGKLGYIEINISTVQSENN
jgi:biopolymer transport protein ExbD